MKPSILLLSILSLNGATLVALHSYSLHGELLGTTSRNAAASTTNVSVSVSVRVGQESSQYVLQSYPAIGTNSTIIPRDDIAIPRAFRITRILTPLKEGRVRIKETKGRAMTPRYQCAGRAYNDYMSKAAQMVLKQASSSPDSKWGRRSTLVPHSHSLQENQNRKILIIGNSFTRQMAVALEWQYADQITSSQWRDSNTLVEAFQAENTNTTTTIYLVYNHPAIYSPIWLQNLQDHVLQGLPLTSMDAIVLGSFNHYDPNYNKTALWTSARKYAKQHPELQINVQERSQAFGLADLLDIYHGPIVSVGGFSRKQQGQVYRKNLETAVASGRAATVRVVDSRAPIDAIGGGNCGHGNAPHLVGTCSDNDGHRCVGQRGGIPDFVAWDVIEALHDLLHVENGVNLTASTVN